MSPNMLLQNSRSFSSPLLHVCVLHRELQFSPELRVSTAQSLQQQSRLLLKLLQLALSALVILDQLLCAHGDPQQARFVENVVGIAETFQFIVVHGEGILVLVSMHPVAVNLCPEFICVGGQRAGPYQWGQTLITEELLTLSRLWLVDCSFKVRDGVERSLQWWLQAGGAEGPVAAVVSSLSLIWS